MFHIGRIHTRIIYWDAYCTSIKSTTISEIVELGEIEATATLT